MLRAIVGLAHYSRAEDAEYMVKTLAARRDIIVRTYLGNESERSATRATSPRS
jgi:hypothetical protein